MKALMITACLLLVALATAQRGSTTPKYIIPAGGPNVNINDPNINIRPAGGQNVNINDPNINIRPAGGPNVNINDPNFNFNDPNININDPNLAQPANGVGGYPSSYNTANNAGGTSGGASFAGTITQVHAALGGLSNSAEKGADTQETSQDGVADANGSVLNLDGTDGDSEASTTGGVNVTALGVVLSIMVVLGIFGVVAIVLIRQRRQNAGQ